MYMAPSPAIFDDLIGQKHAARLLGAVIGRGTPSHAYLFAGPPGTGREAAALRFAAALCCEQGGCGECPTCVKALKGSHPDIETISPSGSFIMVDQVREVNRRLNLRPHESRARVFIFRDAESFNGESGNAFLKSLEEPPAFVFFLLIASREDRVMPTLVSRCQAVRFGPVPAAEIEAYLASHCQTRPAEAKAYAHLSSGNLRLAVQLCENEGMAERRRRYIQLADTLSKGAWEGGARQLAAEIAAAAQEAALAVADGDGDEGVPEGFDTAPRKKREEEAKRRARAAQSRELSFALGVFESWFRDMMVVAAGAGAAVLNKDYELELEDRALPSKLAGYRDALAFIQAARAKLGYNIDVELALTAMFLELQEVL